MSLPLWPEELGRPLGEGWQQQAADNRRRLRGDQGPPRMRRGISKAADNVTMRLILTRAERARFDRFYNEETGLGALPFIVPDFSRDGYAIDSGEDGHLTSDGSPLLLCATWVCMFGEGLPSHVPLGAVWRVSFNLVVLP